MTSKQYYEKMMSWYKLNNIIPRQTQLDAAKLIAKNWNKKYHIIQAPVGTGKSFIGLAMSYAAGKSYILAHTKQLQDQYLNGPGRIEDLRGKANYRCNINPTLNASNAPCNTFKHIIGKCASKGICPYINQKKKALASPCIISNYSYFFPSNRCGAFKDEYRDLMVADEAHIFEDQLLNYVELNLNTVELHEEYGISSMELAFAEDQKSISKYIHDIHSTIDSTMTSINGEVTKLLHKHGLSNDCTDEEIKNLPTAANTKLKKFKKQYDDLDRLLFKINVFVTTENNIKWILSRDDENVKATPLSASGFFGPVCDSGASKFMFMSGTIGNAKSFAKELGIPYNECNIIDLESTFDDDESPIVHMSVGKFSYNELEGTLPKALKVIDQLLNEHKDQKGVIHSTNYRITKYIAEKSLYSKRLIHRNMGRYAVHNDVLLEKHFDSKSPSVLLSPSMGTGISLDDDLARFQIIVKLPFKSLGDERVKAKMKDDNEWYRNQMWQEIIQAAGRATRSEDDWCITYILDESLEWFYFKDKDTLPIWFKNRLIF